MPDDATQVGNTPDSPGWPTPSRRAHDGGRLTDEDHAEALVFLDGAIGAVSVGLLDFAGDIVDRLEAHGLRSLMR